jgi:hypothetical protein
MKEKRKKKKKSFNYTSSGCVYNPVMHYLIITFAVLGLYGFVVTRYSIQVSSNAWCPITTCGPQA